MISPFTRKRNSGCLDGIGFRMSEIIAAPFFLREELI
jgi:hypothetical protein